MRGGLVWCSLASVNPGMAFGSVLSAKSTTKSLDPYHNSCYTQAKIVIRDVYA